MVSVMAAFVILMLGMGMVYTSISFSQKLTARASESRQKTEDTMASYYKGTGKAKLSLSDFTLNEDNGTAVSVTGKYSIYTAQNGEVLYAFQASSGDGWHAAADILDVYLPGLTADELKKISGSALNNEIKKQNDGEYPSVSSEEHAAAQAALDTYWADKSPKENIVVPDNLAWKANNIKDEQGNKTYYLIANTDPNSSGGWKAFLLWIDGKIYVSTVYHQWQKHMEGVETSGFGYDSNNYTVERVVAAINGEKANQALYDLLFGKLIEVNY